MKALTAFLLLLLPLPAIAEVPEIVAAHADGKTVYVTLAHPDTGWDHYADAWEVVGEDGTRLGLRELAHPHVTEQPFTRSLVLDEALPPGPVYVRARCSVDGWGAARVEVVRDRQAGKRRLETPSPLPLHSRRASGQSPAWTSPPTSPRSPPGTPPPWRVSSSPGWRSAG